MRKKRRQGDEKEPAEEMWEGATASKRGIEGKGP